MKVFLISVVFAIVVAFAAEKIVIGFAQESSESAYASTTSRP